jgi:hypothetical protein
VRSGVAQAPAVELVALDDRDEPFDTARPVHAMLRIVDWRHVSDLR